MLFWWESKPGPLYPGRGGWWASAVQALPCCQGRGGGGGSWRESLRGKYIDMGNIKSPKDVMYIFYVISCHQLGSFTDTLCLYLFNHKLLFSVWLNRKMPRSLGKSGYMKLTEN